MSDHNGESDRSDSTTTVRELRELVEQFVAERNWHDFHSPKNLAMSVAIEAAELMEHFQWRTIAESRADGSNLERRTAIGEEMADVLCYLLALANTLDLDLATTVRAKMEKNRVKYPT